jgi:hypothetical protein
MKVVIDRFEGIYAVCEKEDRSIINVEIEKLPLKAKEGDVLSITSDSVNIDVEETYIRKKEIEELTKDLWK